MHFQTLAQDRRRWRCPQPQGARKEVVVAMVLDGIEVALAQRQQTDLGGNDVGVADPGAHRQNGAYGLAQLSELMRAVADRDQPGAIPATRAPPGNGYNCCTPTQS